MALQEIVTKNAILIRWSEDGKAIQGAAKYDLVSIVDTETGAVRSRHEAPAQAIAIEDVEGWISETNLAVIETNTALQARVEELTAALEAAEKALKARELELLGAVKTEQRKHARTGEFLKRTAGEMKGLQDALAVKDAALVAAEARAAAAEKRRPKTRTATKKASA